MVARKCQAINPMKCRDTKCPNRVQHLIHTRDVLFSVEQMMKNNDSETVLEDSYYEALTYDLINHDPLMYNQSDIVYVNKIKTLQEKIDIIENEFLEKYYAEGEYSHISGNKLAKLNSLAEEKHKLEQQHHELFVSHLAQYEGNKALREEIREMKNKYPKPKIEISKSLNLLHQAEIYHRKQIIAALLLDDIKSKTKDTYSLQVFTEGLSKKDLKIYHEWLDCVGDEYVNRNIHGFKLNVDRFGLDLNGEWWVVEPNSEGAHEVTVSVPERFPSIFPQIPNLTSFKETTINRMVVLRRKAKRKIITDSELDMLNRLEYNSRKIAELKQL
jgi:hypothetical protein